MPRLVRTVIPDTRSIRLLVLVEKPRELLRRGVHEQMARLDVHAEDLIDLPADLKDLQRRPAVLENVRGVVEIGIPEHLPPD